MSLERPLRNGPSRPGAVGAARLVGSVASAAPAALTELPTPAERRRVAVDAGWKAGYDAGRQEAEAELAGRLAQAEALVDTRRRRLARLTAAMDEAINGLQAAAASRSDEVFAGLADAACQLAEAIIGRELRDDPSPALEAVRRALAVAPEGPAVARVHPDDLAGLLEALPGNSRVVFEADPGVEAGGCILTVGPTTVDACIGSALGRARAALQAGGR